MERILAAIYCGDREEKVALISVKEMIDKIRNRVHNRVRGLIALTT
jgi:hypothetical protein